MPDWGPYWNNGPVTRCCGWTVRHRSAAEADEWWVKHRESEMHNQGRREAESGGAG